MPPLRRRQRLADALDALRGRPVTGPPVAAGVNGADERSRRFAADPHDRFWWHRLRGTDYVPPIYALLDDDEWAVMEAWYADTQRRKAIGEINVPAMCLVQGLVMGSAVSRIVQLGHYFGYSALLLGFMLRRMGARPGLHTIDIDPEATEYTRAWIERAGLAGHVEVVLGDSADPGARERAEQALDGPPQLLLIDSSHAYRHTLRELDLWVPALGRGGLVLLHDTSAFATRWDPTDEGGVRRALEEWLPRHPEVAALNLNERMDGEDGNEMVYKDGSGLGILQVL